MRRSWIAERLRRRFLAAVLVLALGALLALFAEMVCGEAPILAYGSRGLEFLPGLLQQDVYQSLSDADVEARHAQDLTIWPLWRHGPRRASAAPHASPSREHPLGTDARGRDVLARLIYGARAALGLALLAIALALLLGVALGTLAGFRGGIWDEGLSRTTELVHAFPAIIAVLMLRALAPDAGSWALLLVVTLLRWAEIARLVRAEVVRVAASPHVLAARAIGATKRWLLWRHILPQTAGPLLVSCVFGVVSVTLLEVAAAFLGIGLSDSWGTMIAEGATGAGTAVLWAVPALVVTVLAAQLAAESLAESLDPRAARSGLRRA